jgi:hypothetical protein
MNLLRSHTTKLIGVCAGIAAIGILLFVGIAAACSGAGGETCTQKPSANTQYASSITSNSATLNGYVNPHGCVTNYTFEYGLSATFYAGQIRGTAGNGIFEIPVSATAFSLQSTTTYHYRISATNAAGTTYGVDKSFTTLSPPPPPKKYIALGDSYSSGVGTGSFYNEACGRSIYAYPYLLHNSHPDWTFINATCENRTTIDMIQEQLPILTADVNWITYTIGGNDAEFENVMRECFFTNCDADITEAQTVIKDTLPARLDLVNKIIKEKSPNAKVIVLDYPRLFNGKSCTTAISESEQKRLNETAELMKTAINAAAVRAGSNFIFKDVIPIFEPHAICEGGSGSTTEWINGVSIDPLSSYPFRESFHPKITGQADGYYPIVHGVTG